MTSTKIQRKLLPVADEVREAHRLLKGLEDLVCAEKMEHLRLLVSELVTNAVMHSGFTEDEYIYFVVLAKEQLIRVEVHDGGPGF